MHQHGLAQHVVKRRVGNAGEFGQRRIRKRKSRITPLRLFAQSARRLVTNGVKSARHEPRNLTPAAGPDIGGATSLEKAPHQIVQVGWRWLLMPFCRKCGRGRIVSGQSLTVHAIP